MLRVSKTCPTSTSTCINWTLEWVLSIWGTTRRWPWLFRLPGKFSLILKEKCEHVVTACHCEHPNRWRSGCAGSRGRSQTAGGRGEGRLLRGCDIQTKYPTINGILKGKEKKKRMWRKDVRESISGRGENMCKDPGIRESKRCYGNKARMFSIEGKAHHLGHGTKKDSLLKSHHRLCLAGQNLLKGPSRISQRWWWAKSSLCPCQISEVQLSHGNTGPYLLQLFKSCSEAY